MKKFKAHIEWMVFFFGLVALAMMDPTTKGTSFCLFDLVGISFCPGEGLGHSIAYFFRGEFLMSFKTHLFGPLAVAVLSFRILAIWKNLLEKNQTTGVNDATYI
ncbi:DUF2752 domain-containing protein [Balneola vulgaris]|uniref:DUF2752 domain-containing protein n=1 Tax=Balneola vulgaris TaxID=287535 RepID=UPI00036CD81F|nr:DUF2752 domain-containing protein [Balneola vulgaris]